MHKALVCEWMTCPGCAGEDAPGNSWKEAALFGPTLPTQLACIRLICRSILICAAGVRVRHTSCLARQFLPAFVDRTVPLCGAAWNVLGLWHPGVILWPHGG